MNLNVTKGKPEKVCKAVINVSMTPERFAKTVTFQFELFLLLRVAAAFITVALQRRRPAIKC